MAHEITIREDGFAEIAYAGATPWHRLGQRIDADAPIEQWQVQSGLNFKYLESQVFFEDAGMQKFPGQKAIYRSDNHKPLAIVSDEFKLVQPDEVLDFFRSLIDQYQFKMEIAGSLKEGRRIWGLARTGMASEVVPGDIVRPYMLLVTACDGTLATTGQWTIIRALCANTIRASTIGDDLKAGRAVKVRHSTTFDPAKVKDKLGVAMSTFQSFMQDCRSLAEKKLTKDDTEGVLVELFSKGRAKDVQSDVRSSAGYRTVMQLFEGAGRGSLLEGVRGTAWGLLNAVTEYADHASRAQSNDNRLDSAWFGRLADLKDDAKLLLQAA
jgi:phage/plasmid-like protein (TIGR03299 family)